jgi:PAS domain S-box-containing protein
MSLVRRLPGGLRFRLLAAVVLVQSLATALIASAGWQLIDRRLTSDVQLIHSQIRPLLAAALTPPAAALDLATLNDIVAQALVNDGLEQIVVTARNGRVLAQATRPEAPTGKDGDLEEIALHRGEVLIGTARYRFSPDRIQALRSSYVRQTLIVSVAAIALSCALMAWVTIALTGRLERLRDAGKSFSRGDLRARIDDDADDEIGDLARVFNRMAAKLADQLHRLKEKDERLSLVIQGSSDGIWDWDLLANEVYFSPRFRHLLGYEDEAEFKRGFFISTALHPDDRDRVLNAQYDHLENRTPFDETYRLRCRDGGYRWFRARGQARWDANGKAYRYAGSITDIHTEKLSESARRESEERLYYAIRGSSDGIWDWHLRADRYYLSPRFKQLLGYRDDELPNRRQTFIDLIHPDDRARIEDHVAHHFKTHDTYDVTYRLRHRDGNYRWFRSRGEAVWDERGEVVRFAGSSGDITEQRQAQESIRALLTEKQALLDNVPVGIVFVEDGRIANTNRRFCELLACPPDAAIGRELSSLIGEERATLDSPQPITRELELTRCDGRRNWFYITGRRVNPERPADGSIWIFVDIASLKAASAALREVRDLSDAIIRSLPGVFFLLEASGRIVRWNLNLARVTGQSLDQHDDLLVRDLCHPDDRLAFQQALASALREDQSHVEARLLDVAGHVVPHVFTMIRVELRGTSHLVGVGVDISDRMKAEQEILALNDALETRVRERTAELTAANQELESFSYSVSHDLSSPLRGIDGFSRILEEDFAAQLDASGLAYLKRIRAATVRMQSLIDDLLKLSRITRDEMRREPFDLSELASEIGDYLQAESPGRQVEFRVDPGITIHADRNLMRVAMDNLLRNAWKFTANQTLANIHVGCLRESDEPVYFVEDNGAGFDMQYASKLFGAFQRLHPDSAFSGTGIGLATVSRVVHRHGGRVWANAEVGHGATFYFTLG